MDLEIQAFEVTEFKWDLRLDFLWISESNMDCTLELELFYLAVFGDRALNLLIDVQ